MWLCCCPCQSYKDFLVSAGLILAVILSRMGILWSFFILWGKVTSSRSHGGRGSEMGGLESSSLDSQLVNLAPKLFMGPSWCQDWLPWSQLYCISVNYLKQTVAGAVLAASKDFTVKHSTHTHTQKMEWEQKQRQYWKQSSLVLSSVTKWALGISCLPEFIFVLV